MAHLTSYINDECAKNRTRIPNILITLFTFVELLFSNLDSPFFTSGADWRSGKRSLVRDLAATQFVVALGKSHLPTA